MKRLVVCCDGTWNRPDQQTKDGAPCPTNVIKLAYRVAKRDGEVLQILFYDQGVGTGNVVDRYLGGALGRGLSDNIFDAYRFLLANYEPGDEIYLFGFSRGAFTARSVAGMIRKVGIIRREYIEQYLQALTLYRTAKVRPTDDQARTFRDRYAIIPDTKIRCVGVFDTVGALGVPIGGKDDEDYAFHDTELSGSVQYAFHALAVDERRGAFEPTLWAYRPKEDQIVRQMWFAGAHSDVGGGYGEHELSDIALDWMIAQAKTAGLAFDNRQVDATRFDGKLHDSMDLKYKFLTKLDRPIGLAKYRDRDDAKDVGTTAQPDPTQDLHPSVRQRWDKDENYRPPQLLEYFKRTGDPRGR
jgi:uncharacterized protein (DUF2235 family)